MDGWYADGTQVVFACGGGISSAVDAASANNGKVIGVDVDQSGDSEADHHQRHQGPVRLCAAGSDRLPGQQLEVERDLRRQGNQAGRGRECCGSAHGHQPLYHLSQEQYDTLFKGLADGSLVVDNNSEADKHFATTTIITGLPGVIASRRNLAAPAIAGAVFYTGESAEPGAEALAFLPAGQ